MPLLGAHMSVAGGLYKAILRGKKSGCSAIQVFTANRNRWEVKKPTEEAVVAFRRAAEANLVEPVAAHSSYLINLASSRTDVVKKSRVALLEELDRAALLRIPYLVMHPGSHLGKGEKRGLKGIAEAISWALDARKTLRVIVLLETTSGQGTNLGYRFEHLAEIMERTGSVDRLGVCFDTCHAFAAGYDFREEEAYLQLVAEFDRIIGIRRLKLFHLNDSKGEVGSRLDRHEHIGKGHIGSIAFSFFLNDARFAHLPFLLETPKGKDKQGIDMDRMNLKTLRRLLKSRDSA